MSDISSDYYDSDSDSDLDIDIDFRGKVLNNKYIIIHKIGDGTFATVWLAYNVNNKKYYAIKIQRADESELAEEEIEFLQTIKKHKHITELKGNFSYKFDDDIHICLVFDLLGGSLDDIIKRKHEEGLPIEVIKKIICQLLIAIDATVSIYELVHTDIKPENILIKGIDDKTNKIIKEFESCNFHQLYNKFKKKKKKRNKALYIAAEQVIKKMETFELVDDDDFYSINKKYINENIIIQLSDFGSCRKLIDHKDYNIQTRQFMAPEIIMKTKFNDKCDIWSVGCLLYELLTREVLFMPTKSRGLSKDRDHLYNIQMALGKIPNDMIDGCPIKKVFFKNNGLLKGIYKIEYNPLDERIRSFCNKKNINNDDTNNIIDIMYKMFTYDVKKRPSAKRLLKHKWFTQNKK
uniref:non-specific serine/threonine protein kinase n=1 Tax=Mimivirus LCMiAC02 TaxID=2506609 RepID=A0A481Z282_9VIRU|nr:MAG: dual-specificity protein kinase [Mimivirus LCMiAC02]